MILGVLESLWHRHSAQPGKGLRLQHWLLGLSAAALLVACGGGTTQFEPFIPGRYLAFGDETSVVTDTGRRYSVNVLDTTGAIDCTLEPIWVQTIANQYGFAFSQCNPNNSRPANALMRATVGAKVQDFKTQIDNQVALGGFVNKDLATVLVGVNDVIEVYSGFPSRTEDQLITEVRARGDLLAAQVNRLIGLGVRVVVSTIPDVGISPFGLFQKSSYTDTDRAALLSRLSGAFNGRLRVGILNDGRFVGLILGDEVSQSIVRSPSSYGVNNVTAGVCAVVLPDCTTATLIAGGTSATFLWADDRRLAFAGHQQLGSLALARATGNPF